MVTDTHTLYVKTELDTEKVHKIVLNFIKRASRKLKSNLDKTFYYNPLYSKGTFIGVAYLWVKDSRVYHLLLGRDSNGENAEYILDPEWEPPAQPIEEAIDKLYDSMAGKTGLPSWFNYMEAEEALLKKYEPRYIEEPVNPPVPLPDREKIYFGVAHVKSKEGYSTSTLISKNVPESVTNKQIKDAFKDFSSEEGYPTIQRKKKNVLFVHFASHTNDALFALVINKKLNLGGALLFFEQAMQQ